MGPGTNDGVFDFKNQQSTLDNHQSKSTAFDFFYYPLSPIYSLEPLAPRPPG
jgi:hypothetical protein